MVGPASWMADQRVPPSGMFLERQSAAISRSPVRRHREPSSEQGLSDPRGLHRYGSSGLAPQHAPASEGAVESAQLPCHGGEPRRMTPPDQAGGLTQGRQASNSSPVYRRAGTATYNVADDGMGAHCPQPYGGSKRSFSETVSGSDAESAQQQGRALAYEALLERMPVNPSQRAIMAAYLRDELREILKMNLALPLSDGDHGPRLLSLTTFNEWFEGTSLEPSEQWGFEFLKVLRETVKPHLPDHGYTMAQYRQPTDKAGAWWLEYRDFMVEQYADRQPTVFPQPTAAIPENHWFRFISNEERTLRDAKKKRAAGRQ